MKHLLCALLLAVSGHAMAKCGDAMPLHGLSAIPNCDARGPNCVHASHAVQEYMKKTQANKDPDVIPIWINTSPWRFYDSDGHILSVKKMAAMVRSILPKKKTANRIVIYGSWSGVAPPGGKSLAERLSQALGGMPVQGQKGFLWISRDGSTHVTREAAYPSRIGTYGIRPGADVLMPFISGGLATLSDKIIKMRNAEGLMLAGLGWDTFFLCPERALQMYEAAAKLHDPIAAYNAAIMLLERDRPGDRKAAQAFLAQAAAKGDKPAKKRLAALHK